MFVWIHIRFIRYECVTSYSKPSLPNRPLLYLQSAIAFHIMCGHVVCSARIHGLYRIAFIVPKAYIVYSATCIFVLSSSAVERKTYGLTAKCGVVQNIRFNC